MNLNVLLKFLGFEICRHFGIRWIPRREYKKRVLGETISFMALITNPHNYFLDPI